MSAIVQVKQLSSEFDKWKPTLRTILPRHLDVDRITKIAMAAYMRTPGLQKCTITSIIRAVITASELGLEPGSFSGEAYLVPFGGVATLIPGYKGLIKLARQHGDVLSISAYCVDEADEFVVELGLEPKVVHRPNMSGRVNKLKAVYAVALLKDGGKAFEFMLPNEIDAIRARSKGGSSGPWQTDYYEMAKKTAIKRLLKLLPLSADKQELATAIAASYAGETGEVVVSESAELIEDEPKESVSEAIKRHLTSQGRVNTPALEASNETNERK